MNDLPNNDNDNISNDDAADHSAIDDLARRSGAELRRPAPEGFADGVKRSRRRQQAVRSGLAGVGVAAIIAIGAVALTRGNDGDTVVTATSSMAPTTTLSTTPSSVLDTVPSADTDPPLQTDPTAESTPVETDAPTTTEAIPTTTGPPPSQPIPPIGTDADGVPDAIYAAADDAVTRQDVFDPITLERRETIAASLTFDDPDRGGLSGSGAIDYSMPLGTEFERDDCGQNRTEDWMTGAEPAGLPEWIAGLDVSANGRVGALIAQDCPVSVVSVELFDPDQPAAGTRTVLTLDGAAEGAYDTSLELSDDGSFLLVTTYPLPATEGNTQQYRIIDTATGEVVAAMGPETAGGLPRTDCGLGFLSMRLVSSTALAYTAFCDEGLAVVITDLVSGETIDVLQPEYAGRTYETMTTAQMNVDRATFTGPSTAWFILCAERETQQPDGTVQSDAPGSHPCWLGHGSDAMREIPTATTLAARFVPFT